MSWQNRTMPQWELIGFPTQTASPQPQVTTVVEAGVLSVETSGSGSEKIAASGEQELAVVDEMGAANSAA